MYDLLTFGEIMLRFSTAGEDRFLNASGFDCYVGGAELNVAASVSQLGGKAGIISKIPAHSMGEMARRKVLSYKVSDEYLLKDDEKDARLGIYYYEKANSPRKPEVVYDRKNSSVNRFTVEELPEKIFQETKCFHTSGINLALGGDVRKQTISLLHKFKEHGTQISFDVNFRGNLWSGAEAKESIEEILPLVDIFFCTEDTARLTFLKTGTLREMMKAFAQEYALSYVCSSKRIVHSAKNHSFTSVIYDARKDCYYEERPYENIEVKDRIGSGDAYVAGTLYGLLQHPEEPEQVVSYGNAVGVMKNTIAGDIGEITKEEIDDLIKEHRQSGFVSEMKR